MLCVKATHINENTFNNLYENVLNTFSVVKADPGLLIHTGIGYSDDNFLYNMKNSPDDLNELIHYARSNACEWVLLDFEYAELLDLPTYIWPSLSDTEI